MKTTLKDAHPGQWNEGVEVWLTMAEHPRHGRFLTAVRADGTPCKGMFGPTEGPLQVVEFAMEEATLTMCNLGTVTETQRRTLLDEGSVRFGEWYLYLTDSGLDDDFDEDLGED